MNHCRTAPAYVAVHEPVEASAFVDPAREVRPSVARMTEEGVEAIWKALLDLYRTGTQPAIALCIRRDGHVVLDRAVGHARGNAPFARRGGDKVRATPDTPFCIFSASKAVTAVLIHMLDERGLLRLDDPVEEFIPEFGKHGKHRVTLRHVLTHRAGIPSIAGHKDASILFDEKRIVGLLCEAKPLWVPGRRLGYHAITGGFVLGEVLRRVTGMSIRDFLQKEVAAPLGMRWFGYGVARERLGEVAEAAFTGEPVPRGMGALIERAIGVRLEEAATLCNGESYLTTVVPSGNIVATANELSLFFELLRNHGTVNGKTILARQTVRRLLTESSYREVDLTLGFPVRYGLGVMLGSRYLSPFGPGTRHAYGHYGFINVIGWADPDRGISAALLTSGKPFLGKHLLKLAGLLRAISTYCSVTKS